MAQETLYNKFRPIALEEFVGQDYIVNTFRQSSIQNKFVNTYLFVGSKGSGKTSMARVAANLLVCENPQNGQTCSICKACQSIAQGNSIDIIELDGASKGNVENIDKLIEGAQWSPTLLKKKIYIIDEAHELSNKAISALLKITEEPPEYLVFIFCTTDPKKIPDTIVDRAQKFIFRKISCRDIVKRLKIISNKEKINIDEEAMYEIAKYARGSLRNAIGALQQVFTVFGDKDIISKDIKEYFGLIDKLLIIEIIKAVVNGDMSKIMDMVNDLILASIDVESILFEISEIFRSIMLIKAQQGKTALLDLSDKEIEEIKKLAEAVKLSQLDKIATYFSNIKKEIAFNINERWVLESTLIHCSAILRKT
jgi:DNA polymerase-3 subunit gamma/tau